MSATVTGSRIAVLGGTSEIALAIVRELEPRQVALVGRDPQRLADAAASLRADVQTVVLGEDADAAVSSAFEGLGGADLVVVAVGRLGERGGIPDELGDAVEVLRVNVVVAGALLLAAARRLRDQGHGTLIVLSSVAGERVRPANLVYGAAKAGLDALARGVADALHGDGVSVLIVRPGFVRTRMTSGLRAAPLATDAGAVARAVRRGLERGDDVVWVPAVLRPMMLVIRLLPRAILRRLPI